MDAAVAANGSPRRVTGTNQDTANRAGTERGVKGMTPQGAWRAKTALSYGNMSDTTRAYLYTKTREVVGNPNGGVEQAEGKVRKLHCVVTD